MSDFEPRTAPERRRTVLRRTLGLGAALVFPGCTARPAPPARPDFPIPPAIWRDPFGPDFSLVIDPGHGGIDPGARAVNGLLEKDLTLDMAHRLRARLAAIDGIRVTLTRERDVRLSREDRVGAVRAADADLLLSLHFNDLPQRDITLVETYYAHASNIIDSRERRRRAGRSDRRDVTLVAPATGTAARTAPRDVPGSAPDLSDEPNDVSFTRGSRHFAMLLQHHVYAAVEHGNPRAIDAGVKRDTLFMLTRGLISGALIEMTCLSDATEADRLREEAYRDRLAAALATAVSDYRGLSNVIVPVEPTM